MFVMDAQQFDRISKALADGTRFAVLERIAASNEVSCSDLVAACEVSAPTISHHLKELSNAGLLDSRREAKFIFHKLRRDVWTSYLEHLESRIGRAKRKR